MEKNPHIVQNIVPVVVQKEHSKKKTFIRSYKMYLKISRTLY